MHNSFLTDLPREWLFSSKNNLTPFSLPKLSTFSQTYPGSQLARQSHYNVIIWLTGNKRKGRRKGVITHYIQCHLINFVYHCWCSIKSRSSNTETHSWNYIGTQHRRESANLCIPWNLFHWGVKVLHVAALFAVSSYPLRSVQEHDTKVRELRFWRVPIQWSMQRCCHTISMKVTFYPLMLFIWLEAKTWFQRGQ